jgi:hypothetical protein
MSFHDPSQSAGKTRVRCTMFTEETDDESTDAGFRVIDYLEFTGFDAGIFILSRLDITRSEDSKEELIVSHPQKQKRDTRI